MTGPKDAEAPRAAAERAQVEPSAAQLLSDLAHETIALIRQELELFKTELARKLRRAAHGVIALAVGTIVVFSGWCALLAAATLALCGLFAPWLAAVIVALANLAAGGALFYFAKTRLSSRSFALRPTVQSLRDDAAWLKEHLR